MIIEKLYIANFRSIKDSGFVNLESDLNLLIGGNEAGKTSILRALEAFSTDLNYEDDDLALHSYAGVEYKRGNIEGKDIPMTTIHFKIEDDDSIKLEEISSSFKDITSLICTKYFDNHYEVEIPELKLSYNGNIEFGDKEEEIKSYASKIEELTESFKEKLDSILSDTPYMSFKEDYEELLDKIIFFNEFDDIDSLNYHNKLRDIVTDDEKILKHINSFIGQIESYKNKIKEINQDSDETFNQIMEILPNFMYFSTIEELEDEATWAELRSNQEKFKTLRNLLKLSDLDYEDIADYENRDFITDAKNASAVITGLINESWEQEKVKLDLYVTNTKIVVSIYDDSVKKFYNPTVRSQGFQWFLSFYINFTAGSKEEFKNTIILLDDPGVYLHASGQKDLIKTLEKISELNQIVISTHSPFMIDIDKLERIRIVSKLEKEGSIINEKFYESDFDAFTPIRASIGMHLGDSLFYNKKTVIGEGISDNILLNPMSELLNKKGKNYIDTSKVSILPVNSADNTPYFIAFFLNENIDFTVLLDFDDKGKEKSRELTRKFGDDLKIIMYNELNGLGTGDLEIEDLVDFEFYLKALNTVYNDVFTEKLEKDSLDEKDFDNKSYRGIKKYFRLSKEFKRLDKVAVAKEISKMIRNGEEPKETTISNFSELFGLINEKLNV